MRNLERLVKDYLAQQSDFAVQIIGKWGIGKTYHYRNSLKKLIENSPVSTDNRKKYKPIYVSLFGLKSIDDISEKIVFDFFQSKLFKNYTKNTALKVTAGILKIGLRGFLNFNQLGGPKEYTTDVANIGKNVLDTNELVICFDDLERKDSDLKIQELSGYINSLTDEGIKVLLLSNEDLLIGADDQYANLKEKIIGITVEYVPDIDHVLKNIIHVRYQSSAGYAEFLKKQIPDLIRIAQANDNNLRHIVYALDSLHLLYSTIKNEILDCKHEISSKVSENLWNISIFALAVAIEYKSTKLSYSNINDFSDETPSLIDISADDENTSLGQVPSRLQDKQDAFLSKYGIAKDSYVCYESIFKYATSYDEFNIASFILEFKDKFHLNKGETLPQYEILKALGYMDCFELTDSVYEEKTLLLIEYAANGAYIAPAEYLSVFHYAERFNNILDLDLERVKNKVITGLVTCINKIPPDRDNGRFQFEASGRYVDSPLGQQVVEAGIAAFDSYKETTKQEIISQIAQLMTMNIGEFHTRYAADEKLRYNTAINPIFAHVDIKALTAQLAQSNSSSLYFLRKLLKERYNNDVIFNQEAESIDQLKLSLRDLIDQLTARGDARLKVYQLKEFQSVLK